MIFGNVPSFNVFLIIFYLITGDICKEACFSNSAGIWSHPVALFGLKGLDQAKIIKKLMILFGLII